MPHDPARIGETRAWFEKAAEDLRAAAHDLRAEPPLVEASVFHCQQAAEKAMKGFLTWHGRTFRKTHDLVELGACCVDVAPALDATLSEAAPLTEYAW